MPSTKDGLRVPSYRRHKPSGQAVAADISPAYIDAVTTHLPRAVLVFDRFHVVKLRNNKLSDLRRELYREAKDMMQKDVLEGARWLLLKTVEETTVALPKGTVVSSTVLIRIPACRAAL